MNKKLTLADKVDRLKHKDFLRLEKEMRKVYAMALKIKEKMIDWLI